MALKRNKKFSFQQEWIDRRVYAEVLDEPAVDDIVAFAAQTEAERRFSTARRGEARTPFEPTDELKSRLVEE